VPTLEALALDAAERFATEAAGRLIVPVTDAKRGQLYARLFESLDVEAGHARPARARHASPLRALTADLVLTPEELLAEVDGARAPSPVHPGRGRPGSTNQGARGRGALVVGSGAAFIEPLAPEGEALIFRREPIAPSPAAVARLALSRYAAGEFVADVHALAPVYLRPPEAELRRMEREAARG